MKQTIRIRGKYTEKDWYNAVHVNDRKLLPGRSQKLYNHSPDGFAWGYSGSGPAQLALAILLDIGLSDRDALMVYQQFKQAFIAPLPRASFDITIDVTITPERFMFVGGSRQTVLTVSRPRGAREIGVESAETSILDND